MRIAVLSLLTISCLAVSCTAEAPAAAPAATASMSGTTVDGDTGAPLPSVSVCAYRPDLVGKVEVNLEPAARTQTGIVVDANREPVAKAQVYAKTFKDSRATTDSDGPFVLTGLPNAPVEIRAYGLHATGRVVASRDTPEVVIKLHGCE